METNRTLFKAGLLKSCIASLALLATAASAQTIYKQVDENGRVMFTDQPSPSARVITSYETGQPRAPTEAPRAAAPIREADTEALPDSPRRAADAEMPRRQADNSYSNWRRVTPASPEITVRRVDSAASLPAESQRPSVELTTRATTVAQAPTATVQTAALQPMQAQSPATTANDVTRAINTYTALSTPLAAQVDATESARRARQEANKGMGSPVLVVQAPAKDHDAAPSKSGMDTFYILWVVTFLALAGGLLYVGWQVMRLIMGNAFPRWQIGQG